MLEDVYHIAHCIDYIRQGILCAGDTTMEGKTEYGEGQGSIHQCKDIDVIKEWVDEHMGLSESTSLTSYKCYYT